MSNDHGAEGEQRMKDEDVIALALEHSAQAGYIANAGEDAQIAFIEFGTSSLIAFARAIAGIQKQNDAIICDNCPKRGEQ